MKKVRARSLLLKKITLYKKTHCNEKDSILSEKKNKYTNK